MKALRTLRCGFWVGAGCAVAALAGASAANAETPPVGAGTPVASGSKVTTSIFTPFAGEDIDHYVIDGYAGQTISIAVAATKGSGLLPGVDLMRPDGSIVGTADGAKFTPKPPAAPGKSAKIAFKLDATGVWTVRIRGSYPGAKIKGDNPETVGLVEKVYIAYDFDAGRTTGEYSFSAKFGKPPAAAWKNVTPDTSGNYRFVVPAAGTATFGGTLTFKGGTPTFTSVTAPDGRELDIPFPLIVTTPGRSIVLKPYVLDRTYPLGGYVVTFAAAATPSTKVAFKSAVKLAAGEKALKSKLASAEPAINSVTPDEGGPSINVTLNCSNLNDGNVFPKPRVFLGRLEMENVQGDATNTTITFSTPADLPDGVFDVKVRSTSGQTVVKPAAFRVVPPPRAFTIDPIVGSSSGNFTITITGENFSSAQNGMKVGFINAGNETTEPPVSITATSTTLTFTMPNLLGPGTYRVYVKNARTQRTAQLPMTLELSTAAAINRIVPGLVPVLGGDRVYVNGSSFKPTDRVFLETAPGSGQYDDMTATQTTYLGPTQHSFVSPVRAKGTYRVYVQDEVQYSTPTRTLSYFQLSDFTASMALNGADGYDGYTSALGDYDRDGDPDLFISRIGGATKATSSQTRVFRNDGATGFVDVTTTVMPAVASDDDWRADRVLVVDIDVRKENDLYYPDLVITTNAVNFPTATTKSHTRVFINERATVGNGRVFRDRTADLMPDIRTMGTPSWGGGGGGGSNDRDDWRALDMWIGDVDQANSGPPEIVITTDRPFENYYVTCAPYCNSPYNSGYPYSFYWAGTRLLRWDQAARSGLGRYKFDSTFFPRASGVVVPIWNPPPGVTIPSCGPNACRGTFTPFIGQRLAVGGIDAVGGKPDFAVLNKNAVTRSGGTISSLQVAINVVHGGANVWDVTDDLTGLTDSNYFRADAVAIGATGFLDTEGLGMIAIAKSDPTGVTGSALTMIRGLPTTDPTKDPIDFALANECLPPWTPNDRFQSSRIAFADVDEDGDDDMITVSKTPPGGNGAAFRVFRNEVINLQQGYLTRALESLVTPLITANEHFEGVSLAIGDLDGDGALEFVITRDAGSPAPHTRAISIDK